MSGAETIAVNDHNNEPDDNISNSNNSRLLSLLLSGTAVQVCQYVNPLILAGMQYHARQPKAQALPRKRR